MNTSGASHLPRVSIVTVSYNQEGFIRQALDSFVSQQTDFPYEAIVSDDCSTDGTPAIIAEYAKKYPDIIKPVLRKKNVGVVPNFIEAMRLAQGEYIALCEGDDYWTDPQKLQKQVDYLDAHTEAALCFHQVKVVTEDGSAKPEIYPDRTEVPEFTLDALINRNYIQTNSVMYCRQAYGEMPLDIMPLDWYLHLYHAQFGEIGFVEGVMSVYRRHPGGIWWESGGDVAKLWIKYGLAHLSLYMEILKLYGANSDYVHTLSGSVVTLLNRLAAVDAKGEHGLLVSALSKYPSAGVMLIQDLLKEKQALVHHSEEQAKVIRHYVDLSRTLKHDNDSIEAAHTALKNKLVVRLDGTVRRRLSGLKRPPKPKS